MSEEDLKELVLKHEHSFSALAKSNEHLTAELSKTNDKLEKVASAINTQNILAEKIKNLDENLQESFGRVHKRSDNLEIQCNHNTETLASLPSPATVRWVIGGLIVYSIAFGAYVVNSLHNNENQITYLKGRIK